MKENLFELESNLIGAGSKLHKTNMILSDLFNEYEGGEEPDHEKVMIEAGRILTFVSVALDYTKSIEEDVKKSIDTVHEVIKHERDTKKDNIDVELIQWQKKSLMQSGESTRQITTFKN